MSVSQLLSELTQIGVRIEVHERLLKYAPKSTVTPELHSRMKARKVELLAIIRLTAKVSTREVCGQALSETLTFDGLLNHECSGCGRCFGCRPTNGEVATRFAGAPKKAIPVVDEESQVSGNRRGCPMSRMRQSRTIESDGWRLVRPDTWPVALPEVRTAHACSATRGGGRTHSQANGSKIKFQTKRTAHVMIQQWPRNGRNAKS